MLLTYIRLFVVLDEFSELEVASDDGHLQRRGGREEETIEQVKEKKEEKVKVQVQVLHQGKEMNTERT